MTIVKMQEAHAITETLLLAVQPLLCEQEDTLILHTGLSKLGFVRTEHYLKGLLGFLETLLTQGKTIVLPSFTFTFSKRKQFSMQDPSETGVLADLARKHLQFVRTRNPMFSFTVKGPNQAEFLATKSDSGYEAGTAVQLLTASNVTVLTMGASWSACTVIHAVEERLQVPYREQVVWNYPVDFGEGSVVRPFRVFVRKIEMSTALRFDRIQGVLEAEGALRRSELNGNVIEAANGKKIAELAELKINENKFYFVD